MKLAKLAIACSIILIIPSLINPAILTDKEMIVQTTIVNVAGREFYCEWNQTYGGGGSDQGWALIPTIDGGFALAGYTESYGSGEADMWLVKTSAEGTVEWDQTYGGGSSDQGWAFIQTIDGGFALAGYTRSYGAYGYNNWLVKTSADGAVEWNQTYGGGYDGARALIQTIDGGFAVAGFTRSNGAGEIDMLLVKTSAEGTVEWNQTYGGAEDDLGWALIPTIDGGFALAGYTESYGSGEADMWLVKTSAEGTVEWDLTYGGSEDDGARALIQTIDEGFALAGYTRSYGAGGHDMWLVKTSAEGTVEWDLTYGGSEDDQGWALIQTIDEGFALAGYTESYGSGESDMWLVKTSAEGTVEWNQTYGGAEDDGAQSLIQTIDGGFALAGYTRSYGAGAGDMWLVKIGLIPNTNPESNTNSESNTNNTDQLIFEEKLDLNWNATELIILFVILGIFIVGVIIYKKRKEKIRFIVQSTE